MNPGPVFGSSWPPRVPEHKPAQTPRAPVAIAEAAFLPCPVRTAYPQSKALGLRTERMRVRVGGEQQARER